jgi:hypothetical protein
MPSQVIEMGRSNAVSRCARCVLPENYPKIRFDQRGVCNYCLSYKPIQYKGESALKALLDTYRGRGKQYDCIVAVSGGKDSCFVLYEAAKKYNMRTLAMNYESGFSSARAKQNIKNAIDALGVDYIQIKSRRDIQKKCMKDEIEGWIRNPSSDVVPKLCRGCSEGFLHGGYRICAQVDVPLIILGESQMENASFKKVLHRDAVLGRYSRWLLTTLAKDPLHFHPRRVYHRFLLHMEFPPRRAGAMCCYDAMPWLAYRYIVHGPKLLQWFDYVPYDEETIKSTVARELKWEKPEDTASSWRFDCEIHALVDLMFVKRLGFSEKDEVYSRMIREGSLTRVEALKRLNADSMEEKPKLNLAREVLEKLGLSEIESLLLG